MIYLDTHVVVLLAKGDANQLGRAALKAIEKHDVLVSAAAVLELEFLHEIGRLRIRASELINQLTDSLGLRICDLPFRTVVEHALHETWVRDPFDRMIVGNAKANESALLTKDERILHHYKRAIW